MSPTVQKEVAEKLFESRLHHEMKLSEGWVYTAKYCLLLAQSKVAGEDRVYCSSTKKYYPLTLFEKKTLIEDILVT